MKKKKKLFIGLGALVLLAVIILVVNSQPNEYEKHFVENERTDQPYKLNIPLHEMDFNEYDYYFQYIEAVGGRSDAVKEIELPCDVNYYTRKEDSKPALTLKKGTKVYVMPKDTNAFTPVGYGWCCWPDYDKGWRYGYAFTTEEFLLYDFEIDDEDVEMYYVKLSQLEKVASEFYKANKDVLSKSVTKRQAIENLTPYIDKTLCYNGAYLSNELRELK